MKSKLKRIYSKIDALPKGGVGAAEWILFSLLAIFCYVFYCHQDVLITAGHAAEYLNGHITDFYSACYKVDGSYAANYLPSTFILFAIWDIPMKLFGLLPEYMGDWSIIFAMWSKLLPTVCYFISGIILYRLVKSRFNFGRKKAVLTVFLTYTAPVAFFSQFFFCQYDIFTVLFMLLGMSFYFKQQPKTKDMLLFTLFFAIATTFKYFAFIVFVVLLLLRVKNIYKDIFYMIFGVLPFAAEAGFYVLTDRKAFVKSVFDFKALDYAGGFMIDIGEVSINGLYVALIVIIALAYFTKPRDYTELVGYSMYYSCGVCFALFGLMLWHPQWAIFGVVFWVLSTVINRRYEIFLWLDSLMGVVMLVYFAAQFDFTMNDQNLMRYGIFMDTLRYKQAPTLRLDDIFVYSDANTLFSILCAIFLVEFIFKHPKYNFKKLSQDISGGRAPLNIRYLAFALVFIAATFTSLQNFEQRPDMLWKLNGGGEQTTVQINGEKTLKEYTELDKMTIKKVYIVCDTELGDGKKTDNTADAGENIYVRVTNTATGELEAQGSAECKNIKDGKHTFTKITLDKPVKANGETEYCFEYYTEKGGKIYILLEESEPTTAYYYRTVQNDYSSAKCLYGGENQELQPIMQLVGEADGK